MKQSILFEQGKLYYVEFPNYYDFEESKLGHYDLSKAKALANKVEVKNPEVIPGLLESVNRTAWMLTIPQDKILKDGDTFPLPDGIEVELCYPCKVNHDYSVCEDWCAGRLECRGDKVAILKRIEPETLIRGSNVFGGLSKDELDLVFEYSKCGIYHNCAHKQEDLDCKLKVLEKVKSFAFEPEKSIARRLLDETPQEVRDKLRADANTYLRVKKELIEPEKPEESQEELWAKVINDARWYDGTPQSLVQITNHFKKQGFTIQRKKS